MTHERVTILLVEDNPGDARLLKEALREARGSWIDLVHVGRLADGIERLQAGSIDLVLLDLSLPDAIGADTIAKTHAAAPGIPIVVLTGLDDDNTALEVMKRGAQDYLVKGQVDGQLLVRSIRYAIERKRAEEDARRLLREQAARIEAETAAARSRFLAEASRVLASSLNYETTLSSIARLAVPALASFCAIDIVDEGGGLRRVAAQPEQGDLADDIGARLSDPDLAEHPMLRAIRRGEPVLVAEAHDDEPRARRCKLVVPLVARGSTLGVISLLRVGPEPEYSPEDVTLAEELAGRAALAVDNARLYRAREEVIAIVSHDLRNPLNVISLCAGALRRGNMDAVVQAKQIDTIKRSVERMNRLIEDLLDVTRLDFGRLALSPTRQDAAALVCDAAELFRALAEEKSICLELRVTERLPTVLADRERALQVFSNLIGNAIKFTPEQGCITLSACMHEGELRFAVSDTGPGIDRRDLPRVFDRFWQSGRDSRTRKKGAGLGLTIAKGIVLMHGGRIWVESDLGAGTNFFFTLPIHNEERSADEDLSPMVTPRV